MRASSSLATERLNLSLTGTTAELVEMFRKCFPASDEEMLEGLWLVTEDCPFVAVWLFEGEWKVVKIITGGRY